MESQMRQAVKQTDSVLVHRPINSTSNAAFEKHYSVPELAKMWLLSRNTVRKIFLEEPGVLRLAHEETRYKRRYTTLRIPERIAQRVHRRLQGLV
jgi:Fic family protein